MNLRILRVPGFLFNGLDLRTVLSWKHLEVLEFRLEDTLALVMLHRLLPSAITDLIPGCLHEATQGKHQTTECIYESSCSAMDHTVAREGSDGEGRITRRIIGA